MRLFLVLLCAWPLQLQARSEYTRKPVVDFDLVIEALRETGTWLPVQEGKEDYYFLPDPSKAAELAQPYRQGRWIYSDYGWTWQGTHAASWAVDHYGYWTRRLHPEKKWTWVPRIMWLPSAVEWLQSGEYIGWRPGPLDRFGNPTEREADRYGDPAEWNFIRKDKLASPLKAGDFEDVATAERLLGEAVPADHILSSYREIERPGPGPEVLGGDPAEPLSYPNIQFLPDLRYQPANPLPNQLFIFRPDFHQDNDGIRRRVHLFLNPRVVPDESQVKNMFKLSEEQEKQRIEAIQRTERMQEMERQRMDRLYD
ncbi:MAG: DUF6600 domain-containing protein [Candidatus Methylacidiphilales bacterium]